MIKQELTKKAYGTPSLTTHGDVEVLTQTGHGHTSHGNGNGYGHCKHAGQNHGHMDDPQGGCGCSFS